MRRSSWWRPTALPILATTALSFIGLTGFTAPPAASLSGPPVLLAAGDIDGCSSGGVGTAQVVEGTDGAVATLGDNAYPSGSASDYARCYDKTWGRFKDRTHPVSGNHDYDDAKAAGYYGYFGAAAGPAGNGYYSYDIGTWHVVALNSNCSSVDCNAERAWLDKDLNAHPARCIAAYWHHPRFSSGSAGPNAALDDFWVPLYDHRASIVLSGHDHDYERFAPQDPNGHRAAGRGIREFVVGTGGGALGTLYAASPNSEVRNNRAFGVLQVTLRPDGYDWKFRPAAGEMFTDSGSDVCSGVAPPDTTTTQVAPADGNATVAPTPTRVTDPAQPAPASGYEPPPMGSREGVAPSPSASPRDTRGRGNRPAPASPTTVAPRAASSHATATALPGNSPDPFVPLPLPDSALPARADGPPPPPDAVPAPGVAEPTEHPLSGLLAEPGGAPSSPPTTDLPLVAAISDLTRTSSTSPVPRGRRPLALFAAALLAFDAAALATLNRRRPLGSA